MMKIKKKRCKHFYGDDWLASLESHKQTNTCTKCHSKRRMRYVVDGEVYDSKFEYDHLLMLMERLEKGEIRDLQPHYTFEILKPFKIGKRSIAGMKYTPDFRYIENDKIVIVECKGWKKSDYMMRRKLFLDQNIKDCTGWVFIEINQRGKNNMWGELK